MCIIILSNGALLDGNTKLDANKGDKYNVNLLKIFKREKESLMNSKDWKQNHQENRSNSFTFDIL